MKSRLSQPSCLCSSTILSPFPVEMQLEPLPSGNIRAFDQLENALPGADAVMMLRIQKERFTALDIPDVDRYHQQWGLTEKRLAMAKPDCKVLHPGPVNRGVEVADQVLDGPQSLVMQQVRYGVFVRMAVMMEMLCPQINAVHLEC